MCNLTLARSIAVSIVLLRAQIALGQVDAVKIVNNGPDASRLVVLALAEGYSAAEQVKFNTDLRDLLVNGALGHDALGTDATAFNVYAVGLESRDSGVSHPGTNRETALNITFTGEWSHCYFMDGAQTTNRIDQAIRSLRNVEKFDFIFILVNEAGYGGCRRGNTVYVTSGTAWPVTAHEFGHLVADLYDEYSNPGEYGGPDINRKNISNSNRGVADKSAVIWRNMIGPAITVPTRESLPGIDPNRTVGMFEGGQYATTKVFRPVLSCRMRETASDFCPVCAAEIHMETAPYRGSPAPPEALVGRVFVRLVVRVHSDGRSEIVSARQLPGDPPSQPPSGYRMASEVLFGKTTRDVAGIRRNPFEENSFMNPDGRGHSAGRATSSLITVDVRQVKLEDLPSKGLGIQLYELPIGVNSVSKQTIVDLAQSNDKVKPIKLELRGVSKAVSESLRGGM
jgi:hypothetical protein